MKRLLFVLLAVASGCATKYIPGTEVEDTSQNRGVYAVVLSYKDAFEKRNVDDLLKLCSAKYYEDNGNGDPSDDYGYTDLQARVLPNTFKSLSEVQLELEIKDIQVKEEKAIADVRFSFRAKMKLPAGDKWSADSELNRIELRREQGEWKIVSGL